MIAHSDLPEQANEHFNRIMRDPAEFTTWLWLVMSRFKDTDLTVKVLEGVVHELYAFITEVLDVEDEDVVALDLRLDMVLIALGEFGLTTSMLRRNGTGYDVRSFCDYAVQRAVEDACEAATPGPSHPAQPDQFAGVRKVTF